MSCQLKSGLYFQLQFLPSFSCAGLLHAQTTTGQISGAVVDTSGQVVVGARITLRHEGTRDTRQTTTNDSGAFVFTTLVPATYSLRIENPGFASTERTGIVVTANERRALGDLELKVGSVSESISVRAENVQVQTTSSENSELLSTRQIEQLQSKGRDIVALLRVMPGVSASTDNAALGDTFGTATPNIGGTRNRMNTFTLDGQTGSDADLVDRFNGATSMDAIAEVKVLLNNYQAEYGRNAGAFVNIVSKSGTREFHGSGYWFKRHEQFNANDFFNNRRGQPKPLYRYNTFGGTIGGPVFIPKVFNTNRDKLFFFYSREDWRIYEPRNPRTVTVPTELERQGNFSQSRINNQPVLIRDPSLEPSVHGGQPAGCFPNQTIPANRLNRNGLAILNLFPQPELLRHRRFRRQLQLRVPGDHRASQEAEHAEDGLHADRSRPHRVPRPDVVGRSPRLRGLGGVQLQLGPALSSLSLHRGFGDGLVYAGVLVRRSSTSSTPATACWARSARRLRRPTSIP